MTRENKWSVTENEFEAICERVCRRVSLSLRAALESETLYFAIYWQFCRNLGELVESQGGRQTMIVDYRELIKINVGQCQIDGFNAAEVADRVIARFFRSLREDSLVPCPVELDRTINSMRRKPFGMLAADFPSRFNWFLGNLN